MGTSFAWGHAASCRRKCSHLRRVAAEVSWQRGFDIRDLGSFSTGSSTEKRRQTRMRALLAGNGAKAFLAARATGREEGVARVRLFAAQILARMWHRGKRGRERRLACVIWWAFGLQCKAKRGSVPLSPASTEGPRSQTVANGARGVCGVGKGEAPTGMCDLGVSLVNARAAMQGCK